MARHRDRTWVAVIVVGIGLLIAAGLSLFAYIVVTATPLHPNPRDVPSVTRSAPPPAWGPAIQQARQIVRAAVAEQNLPGLSVAVGVGGAIVWTEGFGWADLDKQVPVALAGKDTRMVGHDGDSLGGTVASLMTFPEHGIVVAVISNISYANTSAVGSHVAQVFAVRGTSAARPAKAGSE